MRKENDPKHWKKQGIKCLIFAPIGLIASWLWYKAGIEVWIINYKFIAFCSIGCLIMSLICYLFYRSLTPPKIIGDVIKGQWEED